MPDWLIEWPGLRILNVVLAMLNVTLLVASGVIRWPVMPLPMRRLYPWLVSTYVVIAYGSGEALLDDVRPGMRVLMMMVSLLGMAVAMLYNLRHGGYDPPPHRGFLEEPPHLPHRSSHVRDDDPREGDRHR